MGDLVAHNIYVCVVSACNVSDVKEGFVDSNINVIINDTFFSLDDAF